MSGLAGALVGGLVFATLSIGGVVSAAPAAAADAASTAQTVMAKDYDPEWDTAPFPQLSVTVSQTRGLVAQGLRIDWSGGEQSEAPTQQAGGKNYLQIMQCWGDAPKDDPAGPDRPDRTTCQYGGLLGAGATRDGNRAEGSIAQEDEVFSVPGGGFFDPPYTSIPFRSVTGQTVANVVDGKQIPGIDPNTNEFFTQYTTNEVSWAGTGVDGTGSTKFEVQTVQQSRGLGCGARLSDDANAASGRSCWLVIVPRGEADRGEQSNIGSGLFWDNWKHHLAVKLDFRPVGLSCAIGAAERQVAGSELISGAVASWQPTLCGAQGGSVFNLLTGAESDSVAAANAAAADAPLALTSLPFTGEGEDRLAYAPVGLTSVNVGFAIDRFPKQDGSIPADALARAGLPLTDMKLTPRLVAKLLTSSYLDALPYRADRSHLGQNPRNIVYDEDFLSINDPEWRNQAIASVAVADLLVPQGRTDAATMLWRYVMADAEARDFLSGKPDRWGTVVNPYAITDAAKNPTQTGLSLPRDNFPRPDPVEVPAEPNGGPAAINSVTWRPYVNDLDAGAYLTLRGDSQSLSAWDPFGNPPRYNRNPRSLPGQQAVMSLTDGAATSKYQLVAASLRNPAGQFVAPTTDGLLAAAAAMTASSSQPQVRTFDAASSEAAGAAAAYPLTMPVYAAASPYLADATLRSQYASFIRYAAGDGQTPGVSQGQLPAGYAPLPDGWRIQARAAATALENGLVETAPPASSPNGSGSSDGGSVGEGAPFAPASASSGTGTGGQLMPASSDVPESSSGGANPTASGAVAQALAGAKTDVDPDSGGLPAALPAALLAALAAVGVFFLIPRLPRRS